MPSNARNADIDAAASFAVVPAERRRLSASRAFPVAVYLENALAFANRGAADNQHAIGIANRFDAAHRRSCTSGTDDVIVVTVTGRGVHETGAGFGR